MLMSSPLKKIVLAIGAVTIWSGLATAAELGFVSAFKGDVSIVRGSKKIRADYGSTLHADDVIKLKEAASASIISYSGCREYKLSGTLNLLLKNSEINQDRQGKIVVSRTLPGCFTPAGSVIASSGGAFVTRGMVSEEELELASIKKLADSSEADAETLLYMTLHHISRKEFTKAGEYYKRLTLIAEDSEYLKKLGRQILQLNSP